jgi:RimJ/RimL family protein N-acetyltransferase
MMPKKLVGENIYLGPVAKKDISILVKWMNDLDVIKFTCQASRMHTAETAKRFLEEALTSQTTYYFGIYTRRGVLIGGCDLRDVNHIQRKATLGIIIGEPKYWNKGYGTEAVTLLLDYGFNVLNLNNIMLAVFDYNPRGIRCYEKAGFRLIGKRRQARFFGGKYYNEVFMDVLADEFKQTRLMLHEEKN